MENEKPRILTSLLVPVILLTLMWGFKVFELVSGLPLTGLGIYPQTLKGLPGILFSPLVHADFSHLSANSVSAFVLTAMLFYFHREIALQVFLLLWLLTGLWVWAGAREAYHIGASGLVYGLAAFLFLSGLIRRDTRLAALALFVVFSYGSLVWGIFPQFFPEKNISWESHLMGLVAGVVLALYYKRQGPRTPRYSWELEEEHDETPDITEHPEKPFWMQDSTPGSGSVEIRYHMTHEKDKPAADDTPSEGK